MMLDRLSELPEPLIHHVMSFLPTPEATRMSTLSRRFKSAWISFPIINLDYDHVVLEPPIELSEIAADRKLETFLTHVHDFLRRRLPDVSLQKFKIRGHFPEEFCELRLRDYRIDEAVLFAIRNNTQELNLDFCEVHYRGAPIEVLSAESVRVLKLRGLRFDAVQGIQDLALSQPCLEEFYVKECFGMKRLQISCGKLKIMEIKCCPKLEQIELDASNLESFSLTGCVSNEIHVLGIDACKLLKGLSLQSLPYVSDEWIKCIASTLSLLESFNLFGCRSLRKLYISNASLKSIEVENCRGLQSVSVVAPTLESFKYSVSVAPPCKIDIAACKLLKSVELIGAPITDSWINANVPEFPFLETVTLLHCSLLEKLVICHDRLKNFRVLGCLKVSEVEIDASNLDLFEYTGSRFPTVLSVTARDVKLSLYLNFFSSMLAGFLVRFDRWRNLKISCRSDQVLIVPEEIRDKLVPPLCDFRHLEIATAFPMKELVKLVDSLLWLAPRLEFITIVSDSIEKTLQFNYAVQKAKEEDLCCCYYRPVKCWRHYLKEVAMKNFEASEMETLKDFFVSRAKGLLRIYNDTNLYVETIYNNIPT